MLRRNRVSKKVKMGGVDVGGWAIQDTIGTSYNHEQNPNGV